MKILITGGAGFIGSHLAEELLKRGNEVHVIDNLSTGSIENIEHLKAHPKFHYTIDTIFNEVVLRELIDKCGVIYHLAAAVGVELIVKDPVNTIETNIHGTELILKFASLKQKKVIVTSTSEVYGKNPKPTLSEEDDSVLGPTSKSRWSYACSKAIDEFLSIAYYKQKETPVVIARLFNTVGPRQTGRYGMVMPRFFMWAMAGQDIRIYGTGKQTRCFTFVNDAVGALISLAEEPKAVGNIYNIGNPEEITIERLAKKIKALTASKSQLTYVPYAEAYAHGFEDMLHRKPDISRIHKLIGYTPKVKLDEILRIQYEWAKKQS
jgi:UDP-glucose 4-epimerase